jgi:hypothetical protein
MEWLPYPSHTYIQGVWEHSYALGGHSEPIAMVDHIPSKLREEIQRDYKGAILHLPHRGTSER